MLLLLFFFLENTTLHEYIIIPCSLSALADDHSNFEALLSCIGEGKKLLRQSIILPDAFIGLDITIDGKHPQWILCECFCVLIWCIKMRFTN